MQSRGQIWDALSDWAKALLIAEACETHGLRQAWDDPEGLIKPGATYVTCGQCKTAARWLAVTCEGYMTTDIREDLERHWRDSFDLFGTLEFGRLVVLARRSWRRSYSRSNTGLISPEEIVTLTRTALESHRQLGDNERKGLRWHHGEDDPSPEVGTHVGRVAAG